MKEPKIYSRFIPRPNQGTEAGNRKTKTYRESISEEGVKSLVEDSEVDSYEGIQAYKDECDIKNILARVSAGDENALHQRIGEYLDTTTMPKTLAEAQNMVIKAEQEFKKLPLNIREKFNHSPEQFIAEMGTAAWAEKCGIELKEENLDILPEVPTENTMQGMEVTNNAEKQ